MIYDDYYYPDKEMGYKACKNSEQAPLTFGQVGVGKGATVGKIRGVKYASKSGVGAATVECINITIISYSCFLSIFAIQGGDGENIRKFS